MRCFVIASFILFHFYKMLVATYQIFHSTQYWTLI